MISPIRNSMQNSRRKQISMRKSHIHDGGGLCGGLHGDLRHTQLEGHTGHTGNGHDDYDETLSKEGAWLEESEVN